MNYFKPHLVKFNNGLFAVRKWRFCWFYKDLKGPYWRSRSSMFISDCFGTEEKARAALLDADDPGTPVT